MDIESQTQIVDNIRTTLEGYKGQRLKVRANMGRSKIIENEGTITQAHPSLFVMEVDRKRGRSMRQSYQYVDVLTGTVELFKDGVPLFGAFVEDENSASEPVVAALGEDDED